ncbi:putative uncharacterized protein DDB_G0282133 [Calliphora vicina]|uniref:putative uncharacterized protein DDB_G0282133 n=1 Tax=Calliphora vicina TaxID=7373 RepID=UPI00325B0E31
MCDINCIWLFNLLVAVVLILLQQQQHVVGSTQEQQYQQQRQQQLQHHKYISPYDGISSYAAAAAANYLRRSTLPHNVVKREIKNDKSTDFISFLNDFNMQDETSIPEDIIDQQHLQEIIDKQQQGIQLQQQQQLLLQQKYVGDSAALAAGANVLNGDGDIIDVNLPYDDSTDTDSDADIILESQRSSERSDDNKTSNKNNNSKNTKTNNNNSSSNDDSEEVEMVAEEKNRKNLKKTNNKKEMFRERKTFKNNNDNKNKETKKQQQIKYENNIDYSNQYNIYGDVEEKSFRDSIDEDDDNEDDEDKFELDEGDDDDGSAEYEKFKSMHEQKQREQQQQKQKQKDQMSTLKTIINEETFTRPESYGKMVNSRDNDKIKHMDDYTDDNNKNININDYEIFHKHLLEQKQQLLQQQKQKQQQQQLNQQAPSQQDAIGDIEENENPNIFKTTGITNSNSNNGNNKNNDNDENKNNFANIFIPRKMKRHNGAARLDDATNRYTKLKQEQLLQQQQQQLKSQINTEGNHPDAVAKVSSQEENFKKKYYDILKENSTSTSASENHLQQQQQQHHHRPSGESNPKDFSFYDENNERESTHEVKKQTAFEKEKSLRRNNKRYGHKTHKKKYKDYLRYSQIMMMTTTSTPPPMTIPQQTPTKNAIILAKDNQERIGISEDDEVADLNFLKDKHLKKFKLEKMKTLIPQAPIFVLKPKEEKENKEIIKELEKVEEPTAKPFYEGQINYFLETPDDDSERANEVRFITKGERVDTNDWYRKLSPVMRTVNRKFGSSPDDRIGIGVGRSRGGYTPYHHMRPQHHGQTHHGQTRNHHYHQQHHHQDQKQHGLHPHNHQSTKHSRHHAYQRKMIPKRLTTTTTPLPPPSRKQMVSGNGIGEMGHQITDIKDLERYYAKWPHLAKVQSQLHEEQMREQQSENYPDYEYDNEDYFEENDNKDDNLPPYIRKFNRRNKQLLDLLEGTIAPPTKSPQQLRWSGSKLQPGPRDSSVGSMSVRIDDDYLKEKRKRYHQRQRQIHDLFAQQRTSTTTTPAPPYPYVNANGDGDEMTARQYTHTENHLPDEDVSISLESNEQENEFNGNGAKQEGGVGGGIDAGVDDVANDDSKSEQEIWQKEIETKSANMAAGNLWQMEKLITSTPSATGVGAATTKKSAIHKLPSYPSIVGGYMNRPRSRSAQFAPSSGSEYRRVPLPYLNNLNNHDNINNNNNNFINAGGFVAYNKAPVVSKTINGRFSANTPIDYNKQLLQQQSVSNTTTTSPDAAKTQSSSSSISSNNHLTPPSPSSSAASSSSVTNSFIYHRVVDASPRLVGAGFIAGRKQRLPFVAITDRRLETSKKSLTDHQKDFEQNHYPLP